MYEVCMSADRRVDPSFDQHPELWTQEPPACLGAESLIYEEDTSNNIGGLLLKSGLVVVFSIAIYGGYQFLKDSNSHQQIASSTTAVNGEVSDLNKQTKTIRKIDLTQTGSIKKNASPIGKPIPIKSKTEVDAKFHVVKSGDTLSAIGRKFKISSADIMEINGIEDARRIKPGMKLIVSR